MAVHAPITGAPLRAPLIPQIDLTRSSRLAIESEIERLISLLDHFDGDCDLEDDDPAFDPADLGEPEEDLPDGIRLDLPRYDVDQSQGPTNGREAYRKYHRELCGRSA